MQHDRHLPERQVERVRVGLPTFYKSWNQWVVQVRIHDEREMGNTRHMYMMLQLGIEVLVLQSINHTNTVMTHHHCSSIRVIVDTWAGILGITLPSRGPSGIGFLINQEVSLAALSLLEVRLRAEPDNSETNLPPLPFLTVTREVASSSPPLRAFSNSSPSWVSQPGLWGASSGIGSGLTRSSALALLLEALIPRGRVRQGPRSLKTYILVA